MRRASSVCAALLLLCALFSASVAHADGMPPVQAEGAFLLEVQTGRVLYQQNADARLPMASTTKIMTALLTIENGDLNETVCVPDEAYGAEGSSMYLNRGERIRLIDLLYGLMLRSGNDAAVTIACHLGGSVEGFAAMMNERAAQLGCTDTHFVTPNGLHDDAHYTSARDLCTITAAAMQNELFRQIVSATYHTADSGDVPRAMKNKNRLLWEYEGGCGVKTGYTKAAGKCLVFAAERDGMLLAGALLDCPDTWNAAYALLDYGFEQYETVCLVDPVLPTGTVPLRGGIKKTLEVYPKNAILYTVRRDGTDELAFAVRTAGDCCAPVEAGTEAGELTLYVNGEAVLCVPLIAAERVPAADAGFYFGQIAANWAA